VRMCVLMQLLHFDIKPANILLDHAWSHAKISDVGEASSHGRMMFVLGDHVPNTSACPWDSFLILQLHTIHISILVGAVCSEGHDLLQVSQV
jgi:hypothetical protein